MNYNGKVARLIENASSFLPPPERRPAVHPDVPVKVFKDAAGWTWVHWCAHLDEDVDGGEHYRNWWIAFAVARHHAKDCCREAVAP